MFYLTQFFDRQSAAPEFQSMRQAYEARFKAPRFRLGRRLRRNQRRAAGTGSEGQRNAQAGPAGERPFKGSQQPVQFDRFGDARRQVFITVIRDGQFVVE